MKRIAVAIIVAFLPIFAMELGMGISSSVGLGLSKWKTDVINPEGNYVADHLFSKKPVFSVGPAISLWFTKNFGLKTGLGYGWYNYNYRTNATVEQKWNYRVLLLPLNIVFGFPIGKSRITIGGGFSIYMQKQGKWSLVAWGSSPVIGDMSKDELESSIVPNILFGAEFNTGHFRLSPAISYLYGLDGVGKPWTNGVSTHHISLNLGLLYYLSS